jgi:hypothetical protein
MDPVKPMSLMRNNRLDLVREQGVLAVTPPNDGQNTGQSRTNQYSASRGAIVIPTKGFACYKLGTNCIQHATV